MTRFFSVIPENFHDFFRKSAPRAFFADGGMHADKREHDEKRAEPALQDRRGQPRRQQRAEGGEHEGGKDQRHEALAAQKSALCVNGKRKRRHGQKGHEIDPLRRRLADAEQRQKRNEDGAAAHAHAPEDAPGEPAQKEGQKRHANTALKPASSMSAENARSTAHGGSSGRSLAPKNPPGNTPSATGRSVCHGTSPARI